MTNDQTIREHGTLEQIPLEGVQQMYVIQQQRVDARTIILGDSHSRYMSRIVPATEDERFEMAATHFYLVWSWRLLKDHVEVVASKIKEDTQSGAEVQVICCIGSNDVKVTTARNLQGLISDTIWKLKGILGERLYNVTVAEMITTLPSKFEREMDANTFLRALATETMRPTPPIPCWRAVVKVGGTGEGPARLTYKGSRYSVIHSPEAARSNHYGDLPYIKMYIILRKVMAGYEIEDSEISGYLSIERRGQFEMGHWNAMWRAHKEFIINSSLPNAQAMQAAFRARPWVSGFESPDERVANVDAAVLVRGARGRARGRARFYRGRGRVGRRPHF